ncbi:MAG: chorismate-binding protein [Mariprofundales bacterium]|nr:chorismate-binding protein [Mariprofundales bacterium]
MASSAGVHKRLDHLDQCDLGAWRDWLTPPKTSVAGGIYCLLYLAYEASGLFEQLPPAKTVPTTPLLYAHHPDWSLRFAAGEVRIVAVNTDALAQVTALLARPSEAAMVDAIADFVIGDIEELGSATEYRNSVRRVQQWIAAGDIFQANIARFWQAQVRSGDAVALYARLRGCNPAPFSCVLRMEAADGTPLSIVSSSPERLLRISSDGNIDTRPIAGTRRLGSDAETAQLASELLLSDKERAEHIMLVDLERNDLGRICQPGTVRVDESMVVERYATVQHIVSNVCGRLKPEVDLMDVLAAMFPGGTITGCPKIRCMEIIHQLEPMARSAYTGGVGYIGWDGAVDINILIRSFALHGRELSWAAGAGIVSDSDPDQEQQETEYKVAGLLAALKGV